MQTEAINHDPAITFVQTGSQLAGRPSMGSWVAYGLGSMNQDLPAFVVLLSRGRTDQPLYDRLWGSGFLPTRYQGVKLRGGKEPVLYLANPAGCSHADAAADARRHRRARRACTTQETGDPEILTRVAQYELAYRMQPSVPELTDLSQRAAVDPRPVRPRRAQARQLRRQLPAGPPAGRARRAVHPALSHGLGPARRPAQPDPHASATTPTRPRRP